MRTWTFADSRAYAAREVQSLRTDRGVFSIDRAVEEMSRIMPAEQARANLKLLMDHRAEDLQILDSLLATIWNMQEPTIEQEAK